MSRTRTSGSLVPAELGFYEDWYSDGSYGSLEPWITGLGSGTTKTINDSPTPGFSKARKNGSIVLTDCSIESSSSNAAFGTFTVGPIEGWGKRVYHGDFASWVAQWLTDASFASGLWSQLTLMGQGCLVKAYAQMNSSSISAIENIADYKSTSKMLLDPLHSVDVHLQKMQKYVKRYGRGRGAIQATANAWLQYRYGWKPLISDVKSAIDICASSRAKMSRRRLVARSGSQLQAEKFFDLGPFKPGCPWSPIKGVTTWKCPVVINYNCRVGSGVIYDLLDRTRVQDLVRSCGLDLRSVPKGMWDITPYSFVADWFVGVGDWLDAITPNPYVAVRGNWISLVWNQNHTVAPTMTVFVKTSKGESTTSWTAPSRNSTYSKYVRTVGHQLPSLPVRKFKPLSRTHLADGVALLSQSINERLRSLRH